MKEQSALPRIQWNMEKRGEASTEHATSVLSALQVLRFRPVLVYPKRAPIVFMRLADANFYQGGDAQEPLEVAPPS